MRREYFSIGGGFVVDRAELAALKAKTTPSLGPGVPHHFENAASMLGMA